MVIGIEGTAAVAPSVTAGQNSGVLDPGLWMAEPLDAIRTPKVDSARRAARGAGRGVRAGARRLWAVLGG